MELSHRAQNLSPSVTIETAKKATDLQRQGKDIVSLTLGQPDFATPKHIQTAAITAITNGQASYYVAASGILELRQAIVNRVYEDYGYLYHENEVVVTDGAKFGLYALFNVLLNEGDEVLIPTPYWVSYSEQVKLAQGISVFVPTTDQEAFKVTPEKLELFVSEKTKLLVLNNPSNPTGTLYNKEELEAIGHWALAHNIYIIADEIYDKLVYNGHSFVSMIELSQEIREQCFIINGASKTYAMTGWRVGYVLGNRQVIEAISHLTSQTTSNVATVSQYAALEAFSSSQEFVQRMKAIFEERLNHVYPLVASLPGVTLSKPSSAFYLYPNVKEAMEKCGYDSVTDFTHALLEEAQVAVVTGEGFGTNEHIRISYATDIETFEKGIERMRSFIEKKCK